MIGATIGAISSVWCCYLTILLGAGVPDLLYYLPADRKQLYSALVLTFCCAERAGIILALL